MTENSLLERYLPRFDFSERHETRVDAPPGPTWMALRELDLADSPVVRLLFKLRGLPNGFLRLDSLAGVGFVPLGERHGREVAMGLAGKFWTLGGHLQRLDEEGFEAFAEPGFAKAAWSFSLRPIGSSHTMLATETRILCLDATSCRRFRPYWLVVRPFSGWTRREALRLVRRRAESAA